MRPVVWPLLLVVAIALVPPGQAASADPTAPGVQKWVRAEFDLAQPSLTRIDLTGTIFVHKFVVLGSTQTAEDMAASYAGTADFGAGQGATFVDNAEAAVRTLLTRNLAAAFPTAQRSDLSATFDVTSLTLDGRTDEFDPPARVTVTATILRDRTEMGLGSLTDEAIVAAFHAGAAVTSSIPFSAEPGHAMTYVLRPPASPAGLTFARATGDAQVGPGGASARVVVDNVRGATDRVSVGTVELREAGISPPAAEDLRTTIDITLGTLKPGVASIPLRTDIASELRAIDVATRLPGMLPPSVRLDYVNADGLRALRQTGALDDAALKSADEKLLKGVREDLAKALEGAPVVKGGIARDDLYATPGTPFGASVPVRFLATATSIVGIPGEHGGDADLALALGGTLRFDIDLDPGASAKTFVFHAPAGAIFTQARGGTLAPSGDAATFSVAPNAALRTASLSLRGKDAPHYDAAQATLDVVVDLKDLDVTLGGASNGDFGTLDVAVTVTGNINVIELPPEIRSTFGEKLEVAFVPSDGLRLLKQRGLLTETQVKDLESALLAKLSEGLADSMGQRVIVTGGIDRATLDAARVSSPLSSDSPVVFRANAAFLMALAPSAQPDDARAVALYTLHKTFSFPKVQGLDTTYTVILPPGLAVTDVETVGGTATRGESDGRDSFTVTPTGSSATMTAGIAVTPTFILIKFWPIVLVAVLALILLAGTPVAIVVLRRRRKTAAPPSPPSSPKP